MVKQSCSPRAETQERKSVSFRILPSSSFHHIGRHSLVDGSNHNKERSPLFPYFCLDNYHAKLICHFNFQFNFSSRTGEILKYDLLYLFQSDLHFVDQNSNIGTMQKLLLYSKSSLLTPPQIFIKCALLIF